MELQGDNVFIGRELYLAKRSTPPHFLKQKGKPRACLSPIRPRGKMRFLEKRKLRRGARVAESACLESTCAGNGTVGSNPTLSAITQIALWARRRADSRHDPKVGRRDSNGGFLGGIPLSGGDRSEAEARGSWQAIISDGPLSFLKFEIFLKKGLGPVRQNLVNPARSGRKQR